MNLNKTSLYVEGLALMATFCEKNDISKPTVIAHEVDEWSYDVCAYYRDNVIHICLKKCAHVGVAGRAWSFPGYVVDRTPYGVIQHELGHHVDVISGTDKDSYFSNYSKLMREGTGEKKITNYCPNDAEWFAEIFRLFVTNPDLLKRMRPLTHARLIADGFSPVFNDVWCERLVHAPARTIHAAGNKIKG